MEIHCSVGKVIRNADLPVRETVQLWKEVVHEEHQDQCTDRSECIAECDGPCRMVDLRMNGKTRIYGDKDRFIVVRQDDDALHTVVEQELQDDVLRFAFS